MYERGPLALIVHCQFTVSTPSNTVMSDSNLDTKIPLPSYLKLFTSNNVPVPKAMTIAGKIYKEYNTPTTLTQLTDVKLKASGIDNQEDRKLIIAALRKAGYAYKGKKVKPSSTTEAFGSQLNETRTVDSVNSLSANSSIEQTTRTKRKRKRPDANENEFLPSGPFEETDSFESLEFNEVSDEEILKNKTTVINRAPVMMAWAMFVAERMHFSREEALSIASVYTEMNAVTKGVSLGIYNKDHDRGREAAKDGSQPYVELIGRRPLYRTQAGQWRALSNGSPVLPSVAFSYISRSFRQTTPYIMGALKLLAESYTPQELNGKAWSLYAEFRPEVNEWGKRSEVKCGVILGLRKQRHVDENLHLVDDKKPIVHGSSASQQEVPPSGEQKAKKARFLTVEEYEAALDMDSTFDSVDLDLF
ncbi:hypothetical protein CPB84DRAFT_1840743 [Gymnopilus junonius]|uniref:Uncharacterized protein n=1 Tax=Gymnopilus junonius TaxID=109634 RepID=A0A9P5P2Y8_GYMJU|nr:hypothetical protein CPB84DRAFT_1840743 [Gymnopilus junonius]